MELIKNLFTGARFSAVKLISNRQNRLYDLGVSVVKFLPNGECKAVHLEFLTKHENEEELKNLAKCFCFPFLAYGTKDSLHHPLGWQWAIHKKRLTFDKAYKDFTSLKLRSAAIRPQLSAISPIYR